MTHRSSRRTVLAALAATALATRHQDVPAQGTGWQWTQPIGRPGETIGDGFIMRHGFATENTWFYPGAWHTGEDYYALDGNTAGAETYAVADGEVVYAGYDYPGPVVIIRHDDELFSMYGHLDDELSVGSGPVRRGQRIGTVLDRTDGRAPSHLHFEIRRFLTTPEVNGPAPRYGFNCGPDCPPGPGYWPMDAPEHPAAMGWLNPTHAMAARAFPDSVPDDAEVLVGSGAVGNAQLWSLPSGQRGAESLGQLPLAPEDRYPLHGIDTGPEGSTETSAEGYRLWYQVTVPRITRPAWVQAAIPFTGDTGSDGRPSSIRFQFLPAVKPA